MPKKALPYLIFEQNEYRMSYECSNGHLARGSMEIEAVWIYVPVIYDHENLKYVKGLGSGASGTVSLYYDTSLKKNVAVKSISIGAKSNRDQIFHEESCFKNSKEGKYVVQKLGYFILKGYVHIVLEYMDEGSLNRHYSINNPIPDPVIRCIAWQLLQALCELKASKITHRDLKPENILLHSDGSVKLSDFGISKVINTCEISKTYVGTLRYMSPERLLSKEYTYRCDYWSAAIVLLEAALGRFPIQAESNQVDFENELATYQFESLLGNVNPELADFLKDWLREERWRSLPEIKLKHPYLRIDEQPITKEISKQIIAEWLKEQRDKN